jgi:putative colanic acid biosynthesis acetyltransferase WcaF
MLLRAFGAAIGPRVRVSSSARIFAPWNLEIGAGTSIGDAAIIYNLGRVRLGDDVTISQRAHLCAGTHDYTQQNMPLLKQPITVGNDVWVAAEAFVGPNVSLGDRAVVGARAVVVRDVPPEAVVAGNPAKIVRTRCPTYRKDEET